MNTPIIEQQIENSTKTFELATKLLAALQSDPNHVDLFFLENAIGIIIAHVVRDEFSIFEVARNIEKIARRAIRRNIYRRIRQKQGRAITANDLDDLRTWVEDHFSLYAEMEQATAQHGCGDRRQSARSPMWSASMLEDIL